MGDGEETKAMVELRKLLAAAGYERGDAVRDGRNYLQLLLARQAQLQLEHQQMVTLVAPALSSTMASVNAARQQVEQQKRGDGKRRRPRREALVSIPDDATLSYSRWFERAPVAMAIEKNGVIAATNARFRARRRDERDEVVVPLGDDAALRSLRPEPATATRTTATPTLGRRAHPRRRRRRRLAAATQTPR